MSMPRAIVFFVLCCVVPVALRAATFVVPPDVSLIESSSAIVIATSTGSEAFIHEDGRIYTAHTFAVERWLKGGAKETSLTLFEYGGAVPPRYAWISGTPQFTPGEQVLLMVGAWPDGRPRTHELILGKFSPVTRSGHSLYLRGVDDEPVFGFGPGMTPHRERARDARLFLEYIEDIVAARPPRNPNYFVDMPADIERRITPHVSANASDYMMVVNVSGTNTGFRWRDFDGGEGVPFRISGTQPSLDGGGAVSAATGAWNGDGGSSIDYQVVGTSTDGYDQDDNKNTIVLGMTSGFPGCGAAAVGCGGVAGGNLYTKDGVQFIQTTDGDVWIRAGFTASQQTLDEVVTHELGHTLGLRHSNEPGRTPNTSAAIMRASTNGSFGANLQDYDREAIAAIYGSGGSSCTPPSITDPPDSVTISSGSSTTLTVTASGTAPFTFQWFRGPSGNTSDPVGANSNSFNTGALTQTTSYWVRVTNSCPNGTVNSGTVTVTVTAPCNAPQVTENPSGSTIQSGQSANLDVTATGTGPLTYQWFRGTAPNTSQPVGTNSPSFNTGVLTQTTSFWVRVSNSCGSANSTTATVTVTTVCVPAQITEDPSSGSVISGQSALLDVTVSGSGPFTFQWFRGVKGDTSQPVGTNSNTLNTGALTQQSSFWVRVTNGCGTDDSETATISIAPCDPPSITQQPASAQVTTGTGTTLFVNVSGTLPLSFQWFRGAVGNTSSPVGTNSNTLNTGALSQTTNFWVRVSNPCGSVDSQAATVTVQSSCTPPTIASTSPSSVSVTSGKTTTLNVMANGTSLIYQWFSGDSGNTSAPLAGATTSSFTTPPVTVASKFWVRVSNSCGSVNSGTFTISIAAACDLAITTQPGSVTVRPGSRPTLQVIASGSGAAYQWFRGASGNTSAPITGATSSSVSLAAVTKTESFWVRVSSSCGSLDSSTATVTVLPPSRHRGVRR